MPKASIWNRRSVVSVASENEEAVMSNTRETIDERKRVGPEDEARENQMGDNGLGPADEDEDEPGLSEADAHGIEKSNNLTTP